jgi:GNAT superfamily N-acetyltransferase
MWLAFCEGRVAAMQGYWPAEEAEEDLLVAAGCCELEVAGTCAWARGRGIGQALTRHGLAQARLHGYRTCMTDWRSTNLLSSRFWPRQGFRPAAYRLVRRVDERITWASLPSASTRMGCSRSSSEQDHPP